MRQRIPNILTLLRVAMAIAFVACLSFYQWPGENPGILLLATILFVVAAATDALDGFLARRWNAESVFGRIADPAADKVLVLGAFVLLAAPGFYDTAADRMASGVDAWMVVLILAREICVTTMRAVVERSGVSFGAVWTGKFKMIFQSVGAPAIMVVVYLAGDGTIEPGPAMTITSVLAWLIVTITALSGVDYAIRGAAALRTPSETPES